MKALVIGGTGPTGPHVVEGLLDRGYAVAIFHSGQHEVEFSRPVEHIHADAHFRETLEPALGQRTFDLIVAMYGRLRITAEVARGRTGRVVAVTGVTGYVHPRDPRWGPLGRPLLIAEDGPWLTGPEADKFGFLSHQSEERLLEAHQAGAYSATVIRPPINYGPRQLGPEEWCIVRRVLDARTRFLLPDGGLKVEGRIYTENAAAAVLLAVDRPEAAGGKRYNVRDERLYTLRQRVELVAAVMGHRFEFVELPYAVAKASHVLVRHSPGHLIPDDRRIRAELGHRDRVPAEEAIARTARWLLEHRPAPGGEEEQQLGDPFDYAYEDALMRAWEEFGAKARELPFELPTPAHRYRHPKRAGESWGRPDSDAYQQHMQTLM